MTATGFVLISAAVIVAAVADYAKWKHDRQKFTSEELRRIIKKL